MNDYVRINIKKKEKDYPELFYYLKTQMKKETTNKQMPRIRSIDISLTPDVFFANYREDGVLVSRKFQLVELSAAQKEEFLDFFNKYRKSPSYSKDFFVSFLYSNFESIKEEVFLYFKNLFPELTFLLVDVYSVKVSFNNEINIADFFLDIYIDLCDLDVNIICNNYINYVCEAFEYKISSLNYDTFLNKRKDTALLFEEEVLKNIKKNPLFSDWIISSHYLSSSSNEYGLAFDLEEFIDADKFHYKEVGYYEKLGIKNYEFSFDMDYVLEVVNNIIDNLKNKKIYNTDPLASSYLEEKIFNDYNNNLIHVFHNLAKIKMDAKYYIIFPDIKCIHIESSLFYGEIIDGTENIVFMDKYKKVMDSVSSKKYESCKNYYFDLIQKYNLDVHLLDGEGLLFGKNSLEITTNDFHKTLNVTLDMPLFSKSMTTWKKTLKKCLLTAKNDMEDSYRKEFDDAFLRYPNITGMFLPRDILLLINLNKTHITENIICSALKSKSDRSSFYIKYSKNCGKYVLYKSDEIKKVLEELVLLGLVSKKIKTGDYGEYVVFCIARDYQIINKKYEPSLKEVLTKINNISTLDSILTDDECVVFFNSFLGNKTHELKDYMNLLKLINNKSFLCFYKSAFIKAFFGCPDEIITFITMKKKTEENIDIRRIYKKIIDENKI